jgi:signal transduction histidine kinase
MSRIRFQPTVRAKLTLLGSGLFLLLGLVLIVALYLLVESRYPGEGAGRARLSGASLPSVADPHALRALDDRTHLNLLRQALAEQRDSMFRTLLRQSLIALGCVAALSVALGWVVAGRVLRPLQHITTTVQRVAGSNLDERIALGGPPDELRRLADTCDAMLERLNAAFDSQRRFVANASHELRTPLTLSRALLESALSEDRAGTGYRKLHETLLATNERSELLIDGLLALASSDGRAVTNQIVDLSEVAAQAVENSAGEASAAGVTLRATPDPALTVGDPTLLERLALNLLQNGARYNRPGGWVEITTGPADTPGQVELTVSNTGPEVPAAEIDGLFEPFRRIDRGAGSGNRGAGLGLSIVRSVAVNHGGDVLATPRAGGGLTVRVRLPGAAAGRPASPATTPESGQ